MEKTHILLDAGKHEVSGWMVYSGTSRIYVYISVAGGRNICYGLANSKADGGCRSLPQAALQRQLEDGRNEYYIF